MALTQVKTSGIADDAVTQDKVANDAIDITEIKAGTDGELITYDASGNPAKVGAGTSGHFLKSQGAGNVPVFAALPASGITDVVSDTTPQLGGDLDTNSFEILLDDDHNIKFGTDNDLTIHHAGAGANKIISASPHTMYIASDQTQITNTAIDEACGKFIANGAAELYYDNVKKFETTAAGTLVTGNIGIGAAPSTGYQLQVTGQSGYDDIARLTAVGTNIGARLNLTNTGTGTARINATNNNLELQTGAETALKAIANGAVELYYNNVKQFETTSAGIRVLGGEGEPAYIYMSADEGDDNADKWVHSIGTDGIYTLQNYTSGSWEKSIQATGNGALELYYDNVKTFETTSSGVIIQGGEGSSGHLYFYADEGDDAADKWVMKAEAGSSQFTLRNIASGSWEESIIAKGNGAVELYYDNSKKFDTQSWGAKVYGNFVSEGHTKPYANNTYDLGDNSSRWRDVYISNDIYINDAGVVSLGDTGDLKIYHTGGGDSFIQNETAGSNLQITSANEVQIKVNSTENAIECNVNGSVDLYYDNVKKFETTADGVSTSGRLTTNGDYNYLQSSSTSTATVTLKKSASGADAIDYLQLRNNANGLIGVWTGTGHLKPGADGTMDLGSSSLRWNNLYINDLNLSNKGSQNSVDGTWGDWTLQEGEENIFMINNRSGKKYKMNLTEVS